MSQNIVNFPGASLRAEDARFTTFYANNVSMHASSGLEQITSVGHVTTTGIEISNIKPSTSTTTGALVVSGGVGIAGNVNVGGNVTTVGQVITTGLEISQVKPSTSTTTGALVVNGGVGMSGNVNVGGNATITENLTVRGGTMELTQVANTFQIKSSSNVVTEFVRSKKLIKYPRVAMTAATTAGYTASASSENNGTTSGLAYFAFDGVAGGDRGYHSSASLYSSGIYQGSAKLTGPGAVEYDGEWIKLELPHKIKVTGVSFAPREEASADYFHRIPRKGYILGSNTGSDGSWELIHSFDNVTTTEGVTKRIDFVGTSAYYNNIAMVAEEVGLNATYGDLLNFAEMEYFGTPEYDPDAHGADVIVRSVPNVPNTDWLEVYYDGQDYTSMPGTVTDKTDNGNDGTPSGGVGFDTEYKAFTFDESDDYITFSHGKSGNYIFSGSIWFKSTGSSIETLFTLNGDNTANQAAWLYGSENDLIFDFSNNAYTCNIGRFIGDGQWHHVCCTYNGDGQNGRNIYLDGVQLSGGVIGTSAGGTLNLTNATNAQIGAYNHPSLGYIHEFKGSIANFRLFNRTLTEDEVWQLYAYQKEYFNVSPDVVTFKGGRLGIGTTEPRAVLDVQGDFHAHGSVVQVVTNPVVGQYNYSANAAEVEIAALRTSFSPKFSDSLVLVQVYLSYEADYNAVIYIRANGNDIPTGQGRDYGQKEGVIPVAYDNNVSSTPNSSTFVVHHVLNGETSVEYKVYYRTNSSAGTLYLNRAYTTVDEKGMCYVVITEIGQ